MPVEVSNQLPSRLTISLWDFSWYIRAGDAFSSLEKCFDEAADRGYNTIRICAMPLLLFGPHDLPERNRLVVTGMGGGYGKASRWYDGDVRAEMDPLERLEKLFELAAQRDMYVILSSWEFQQSPAFAETRAWYDAIESIPYHDRFFALAEAFDRMLSWLSERGHLDRVAYVELHNEIDVSRFGAPAESQETADLHHNLVEKALCRLQLAHPGVLVTMSYTCTQVFRLHELPPSLGVAHVHPYVYGVLTALNDAIGLRFPHDEESLASFPNATLRGMLRKDAPAAEAHRPDADWRLDATLLDPQVAYVFDFIDPEKYDAWLYAHWQEWRREMQTRLAFWIRMTACWARERGIPAVIGEGYVGYTPLHSTFEDGPAGKGIAEFAIQEAVRTGFWGVLLSSNASPIHPLWADIAWQRRWNEFILSSGPS